MQTVIDITMIVIGLFVIGVLLKTLAQSQKAAEDLKPKYKYKMVITIHRGISSNVQTKTIEANNLEYLQYNLNCTAFHAIKVAAVFTNGAYTHKMDATGVLRGV
jgi:hypothetical protein